MTDRRILPAAQAQLIDARGRATQPFYDFLRRITSATSELPPGFLGASFVTATDETALLPGSRQIVAGTNVTIDDTVDGRLSISANPVAADQGYPPQLGYAGI